MYEYQQGVAMRDEIARTLVESGCNDEWPVVRKMAAAVAKIVDASHAQGFSAGFRAGSTGEVHR